MVRSVDAADPASEKFIRPYSLQVIPSLDRIVSTSTDMYLRGNSHVIQVWRLSDLKLLKTIVLPHEATVQRSERIPLSLGCSGMDGRSLWEPSTVGCIEWTGSRERIPQHRPFMISAVGGVQSR
jgi:hypothetical protein